MPSRRRVSTGVVTDEGMTAKSPPPTPEHVRPPEQRFRLCGGGGGSPAAAFPSVERGMRLVTSTMLDILMPQEISNRGVVLAIPSDTGYQLELDGFSAVETTAANGACEDSGRLIPILALTIEARRKDHKKRLSEGTDSYLSKPVSKATQVALGGLSINRNLPRGASASGHQPLDAA
jgi:CheY-like chemotaxis protein